MNERPRLLKGIAASVATVSRMIKTAATIADDDTLPTGDRFDALQAGIGLTNALARLASSGKRRKAVMPKQEMSDILR
jgi:hypothetical protein